MTREIYLSIPAFISIMLLVLVWIAARAYLRFRGARLVTCPETGRSAVVDVDARHAALTAPLGKPVLQLEGCSQWPEHRDCDQQCLSQIEAAPEDCRVRTIITNWYKKEACVRCGRSLNDMGWLDHEPALMSSDHVMMELEDIPAEKILEALATHMPVCWDCHMADILRRRHPELFVGRPVKPSKSQPRSPN